MGGRLAVGLWTLAPSTEVRILAPQPMISANFQAVEFDWKVWQPMDGDLPPVMSMSRSLVLPPTFFRRDQLPWEAAFLAGKCFLAYRKRGGRRGSTLPDFFIGAHAAIARIPLLTRDVSRYRTYFPKLKLVAPD